VGFSEFIIPSVVLFLDATGFWLHKLCVFLLPCMLFMSESKEDIIDGF